MLCLSKHFVNIVFKKSYRNKINNYYYYYYYYYYGSHTVVLTYGSSVSLILFIIFRNRISRHSLGPKGVWFGSHWILSLLIADDVVLFAPSSQDIQHLLGRFAAKLEVPGMRTNTSKSKAMVLDWKKVACSLQVGGKLLPRVQKFKYLGVLFTSEEQPQ